MLDSEAKDEVTEAPPVEETPPVEAPEPQAEVPEDDGGEIVISIEGEEPEADPDAEVEAELGDAGKRALKAAREAAKATAAKLREAEAKLAAVEAQTKPKEEDVLGPRPVIADYGFNDDAHAEALLAWSEKKRALDAKKAEEQAAEKAANEAYQAKLARYHAERVKVGVDDDAQAKVVAVLDERQQTALMHSCPEPEKMVAALAKTPKVLAEVAAIKDPLLFVRRLTQIEGKIQMTTKAPPPPESKLRGGGAAGEAISSQSLDKLKAEADRTGDYTAYFAAKRRANGQS